MKNFAVIYYIMINYSLIIKMLIQFLFLNLQEGLFERSWLKNEILQIRDCLDTGTPDVIRILCCWANCILWNAFNL